MTLEDLATEFTDTLRQHLEGRSEEECLRRLLLAAGEHAAAEVEYYSREQPWPWPPKRPHQNVGGKREASS